MANVIKIARITKGIPKFAASGLPGQKCASTCLPSARNQVIKPSIDSFAQLPFQILQVRQTKAWLCINSRGEPLCRCDRKTEITRRRQEIIDGSTHTVRRAASRVGTGTLRDGGASHPGNEALAASSDANEVPMLIFVCCSRDGSGQSMAKGPGQSPRDENLWRTAA